MLRGHVEPTASRTASLSSKICWASTFFPTSALLINLIPSAASRSIRRWTICKKKKEKKLVTFATLHEKENGAHGRLHVLRA